MFRFSLVINDCHLLDIEQEKVIVLGREWNHNLCINIRSVWILMLIRAWPENWDQIGLWKNYVPKYHSGANRANILSTHYHFPPFMEDFLLSMGEKYAYFHISSQNSTFLEKNTYYFEYSIREGNLKPKTNANFALSGPIFKIWNSK